LKYVAEAGWRVELLGVGALLFLIYPLLLLINNHSGLLPPIAGTLRALAPSLQCARLHTMTRCTLQSTQSKKV